MARITCNRCGLEVAGAGHATAEDCLRHLAPRYSLAQRSLEALHHRYRTLEERMERMRIQQRVMKKDATRERTLAGRLARVERALGLEVG